MRLELVLLFHLPGNSHKLQARVVSFNFYILRVYAFHVLLCGLCVVSAETAKVWSLDAMDDDLVGVACQ